MSKIPQRKHTKDEIAELRAQKAMQMAGQPVVNPYDKKLAKTPVIIIGYICSLFAPLYLILLKFQDKINYEVSDLKVMCVGTILAILIAVFIFLTRSLSRHHASFMIIIALISSFSMVYLVKDDSILQREVMTLLGQETTPQKSEAELIVEEALRKSAEKTDSPTDVTPGRRQLTAEEKALREEANRAFAESEAESDSRYKAEQTIKKTEELRKQETEQ